MKQLLLEAKFKIEQLRNQNEILSAKVEVLDLIRSVQLNTAGMSCRASMGSDICQQIEAAVKHIEAREEAEKEQIEVHLEHERDRIRAKHQMRVAPKKKAKK